MAGSSQMQGVDIATEKMEQRSVAAASDESGGSSKGTVINLDHGDPTIFGAYWRKAGERGSITIRGEQCLSYFARSPRSHFCWFMEAKLEDEIRRLHTVVGNAEVEHHHIVVGNGSSQLIQAALYALCHHHHHPAASVVSAAPYYSTYQEEADLLRSALFRWGGDAKTFDDKEGPYVEMVTSPNNPDGEMREPVVNRPGPGGSIIYDLAYYWPQYTPITAQLDHDIMLFTASKCTGHAGSRIGWALVRDIDVAKKMVKFIEVNTIGVAKESQLRAAQILGLTSESCGQDQSSPPPELQNFFLCGRHLMADRWKRLRSIVEAEQHFSLPNYPLLYCQFTKDYVEAHPAFAWMSCKSEDIADQDCAKILKDQNILARTGTRFGTDPKYVRISMLSKDEEFDLFLQRLSAIQENI